jgi:hypothetical protein
MGRIKDLLSQGKTAEAVGAVEVPSTASPPPDVDFRTEDDAPTWPPVATQGTEHPLPVPQPVVLRGDQSGKQARVELVGEGLSFGDYLVSVFGEKSDGGRHVTAEEWKQIGKRATHFGVRILVDLLH